MSFNQPFQVFKKKRCKIPGSLPGIPGNAFQCFLNLMISKSREKCQENEALIEISSSQEQPKAEAYLQKTIDFEEKLLKDRGKKFYRGKEVFPQKFE